MDPIAAKGLGGIGGLGGQLGGTGAVRPKGVAGQFEATRIEKLPGKKFDAENIAENFFKTGRMEGTRKPSMAEQVAMRDGIAFQPMNGTDTAWRPNQVQATGKTESVAGALENLNSGQQRLDEIIGHLQSGKEFSQPELIGLQAEVHLLSEQIQMSTKLVDSAMQSIKQVMQQQA